MASMCPAQVGLTAEDQLLYNRMIAKLAHDFDLTVCLKNDLAQVHELVDDFDCHINEQGYYYKYSGSRPEWCYLDHFIQRGKAVFGVEYDGETGTALSQG